MKGYREILEHQLELIQEALYFADALDNEDYDCEEDKGKLEEELKQILKELNIELENE
jgi:division protein CdvB (Snf7/Vps24/ESCRT-III family)